MYEYETEVPGAIVEPSPGPLSRREEARRDRLLQARIEREAAEARARMRMEADREWEASRARAWRAREDRRERARQMRAGRAAWLREHTIDLLFVPVIAVPAALAWTAMAAYGASVYGPPGRAATGGTWRCAPRPTLKRFSPTKASRPARRRRCAAGARSAQSAFRMPWTAMSGSECGAGCRSGSGGQAGLR
jgi:hypothetical protein